ncbi:MAG: 50S ribosomal protein L25/general stress protein Ctc [Firmicutes bacterium]|nr:50S ribosomal protein L25/general stress protein Ctc [Bacillota bacterium]
MGQYQLAAELRDATGKGANRRLRRAGYIPGVIYGSGKDNVNLQVEERVLLKLIREGGANRLITLQFDGETRAVLIQELQEHPVQGTPQHIDFLEVRLDEAVNVMVPIHIVGEAERTNDGGVLAPAIWEVEVSCLPTDIPDGLEVDVSGLVIGDSLQVKDIEAPSGITFLTDPEETVVSVVTPMELVEEEDEEEEELELEDGAEVDGAEEEAAEDEAEETGE